MTPYTLHNKRSCQYKTTLRWKWNNNYHRHLKMQTSSKISI